MRFEGTFADLATSISPAGRIAEAEGAMDGAANPTAPSRPPRRVSVYRFCIRQLLSSPMAGLPRGLRACRSSNSAGFRAPQQ